MKKIVVCLFTAILVSHLLPAQDNRCTITSIEGLATDSLTLISLSGDSLVASRGNALLLFNVDDIQELRLETRSRFVERMEVGGLIVGIPGVILGYFSAHKTDSKIVTFYRRVGSAVGVGFLGGLIGAVLGVLFDAVKSQDMVYHFVGLPVAAKRETLESIVAHEKQTIHQE